MQLNKKGFAISMILYAMIILIMAVLFLLIGILYMRNNMSKTVKNDVVQYINQQGISDLSLETENKLATNVILNTHNCLSPINNADNCYFSGSNPNNYLELNNELWRIIGLIEVDNALRVKLVKNDPLEINNNLLYNVNNKEIINSNLMTYLTTDYLNSLSDTTKNYILESTCKNTEYSNQNLPINTYNQEKSSTNSIRSKICLINASDFGYAADSNYLTNNLSNYSASINHNWLALEYPYFTMNYYNNKLNIVSNGNLVNDMMAAYVYPTVYLRGGVLITSGDGTLNNPYKLK